MLLLPILSLLLHSLEGGPAPEIMTPAQLAAYLNLSRSEVYRLARRNMPAFRIGPRVLRFRKRDIDSWLDRRAALPEAFS